MHELNSRYEYDTSELDVFHAGKDASIDHMLSGGNGFARCGYRTPWAIGVFDHAMVIERSDLRSMKAWERDLQIALEDRRRGRTS